MKVSRIKTLHILAALVFYTVVISCKTVFKYFFSTTTRPWADKALHQWTTQLLDVVQVQYEVFNPHNVQPKAGQPTILMCNHSSIYDIPLSFKAFPEYSIRMLAKKELSRIPIFGKAMSAADFPFIDRKNRFQAIKDLEHVQELMESGIIIWIAPEGTRSKTGKLIPFKKGAFVTAIQAQATIIPIGIRGAFDIIPAHTFQINLQQKAEIHIGAPIDASQFTMDNKEDLLAKTFNVIKKLSGEE